MEPCSPCHLRSCLGAALGRVRSRTYHNYLGGAQPQACHYAARRTLSRLAASTAPISYSITDPVTMAATMMSSGSMTRPMAAAPVSASRPKVGISKSYFATGCHSAWTIAGLPWSGAFEALLACSSPADLDKKTGCWEVLSH